LQPTGIEAGDPAPTPRSVFIALTPFHLLLSLVSAERSSSDAIILLDEEGTLGRYEHPMRELCGDFQYISYPRQAKLRKIAALRFGRATGLGRTLREYTSRLNMSGVRRAFVFNDNAPVSQFLIDGLQCEDVLYVEDGSAPYNDHEISNPLKKRVLYRLAYGRFYRCASVLGTSTYITGARYTFPNLIRSENRNVPAKQFSPVTNYAELMKRFIDVFPEGRQVTAELRETAVVLVLPGRGFAGDPRLVAQLSGVLRRCREAGCKAVLKTHPLDPPLVSNRLELADFIVLPSHLPAEALPAALPGLKVVYGPPNTTLLACRFFFPSVATRCLTVEGERSSRLLRVLSAVGTQNVAGRPLPTIGTTMRQY
jgi:hypothetical protein